MNFNHFTGVDYNNDGGKTAIYKIEGNGKDWAQNVDSENKNYDYLSPSLSFIFALSSDDFFAVGADLDHDHPEVEKDVLAWGPWVMSQLNSGAAGFRFDAIKHIDSDFIAKFVKHVRKETGKGKLFAVGEFWKDSIEDLTSYLESLGTQVRELEVCSYTLRLTTHGSLVCSTHLSIITSRKPVMQVQTMICEKSGMVRSFKFDP